MADMTNEPNLNDRKAGPPGPAEPAFEGIAPLLTMIRASEKHYDIEKLERA